MKETLKSINKMLGGKKRGYTIGVWFVFQQPSGRWTSTQIHHSTQTSWKLFISLVSFILLYLFHFKSCNIQEKR